ncbi:MAG: hypothetical protein A3I61_17045 [Acidobacteria bacterium RIFCSPLOWO2_02_FULL_68_18]|nr:MAG: hypothetical protein A3I61_17045 [Acidobacteria bacterium RIFCSPLOWO2_02_FULL_68_18]
MVTPTTPIPRWRTLALLMAAAGAVKLAVLLQLHDHPLLQPHGELGTAYYVDLARWIADHGLLAITEPFFVSPLYVYFLATIFALGGGLLAARLVQIALGVAAVGLQYATARWWFGERAAAVAAVLAVLFSFYEVLILQAALDPFLVSAALFLVTRTLDSRRPVVFVATGIVLGLLVLDDRNY